MTMGREEKKLVERMASAMERNADVQEKILELATQEQIVMSEPGPPVCPHCGKLNPEVTELGTGGSGPLGDFVMVAETHCCNKQIYALPIGFDTFMRLEEAQDVLTRKRGG